MWKEKKVRAAIALVCTVTALFSVVAIATGAVGGGSEPDTAPTGQASAPAPSEVTPSPQTEPDSPGSPEAEADWDPVYNDEALPCTGREAPVNFETFSPGPSVAGLPLTVTERRCDGGPVVARANYVSYIYGDCEIAAGATGCQPPLEVQTWPACQRYLAKYSYGGDPLPRRRLGDHGAADVVEIDFALENRIEVYTKRATIVIHSTSRDLALAAVELLLQREKGEPPATSRAELRGSPPDGLAAPAKGSERGHLACHA